VLSKTSLRMMTPNKKIPNVGRSQSRRFLQVEFESFTV